MKKILMLLVAAIGFCINSNAADNVNSTTPSENYDGTRWKVTVTYKIIHKYYEDKEQKKYVTETSTFSAQVFEVYSDTPDRAEREAKGQCSSVCQTYDGRYVGQEIKNNKLCHKFEYREVWEAKAELAK